MTLPEYHHTELRSLHGAVRDMFAGYGSYGGLNIEDDGKDITFVPQKCHPQPGELRYSAHHPTMPLFPSPSDVPFPFVDHVSGARLERQRKVTTLFRQILERRKRSQRARGAWDHSADLSEKAKQKGRFIRDQISKLEKALAEGDIKSQRKVMLRVRKMDWIKTDVQAYTEIGDFTELPPVNSEYTGGCLTSLERGDKQFLIHPAGTDWDQLSLTAVRETGQQGIIRGNQLTIVQAESRVYQVLSQTVNNSSFCSARMKDSCSLWKVSDTDEATPSPIFYHLDNQLIDSPSSVCISPYIPAEVIVAKNNGDALLWSAGEGVDVVVKERSPRFECPGTWRQCQYAAHPRLITMADNSMLQLHDLRVNSAGGTDLFALPSKLLHNEERIQVTAQHPRDSFYHFLATDYSLFLLDQRFPGHPVLQWYHMLNTPQYISSASEELADSDDMVLLACQDKPETYAFHYSLHLPQIPPQAKSLPFRISKIDDFTVFPDLSGVINNLVIKDRFSSSLAGMSLLTSNTTAGRFTAFQLDCHGDVFYQTYNRRTLSGEITQSPGPGSGDITLSDHLVDWCTGWLRTLETQTDSWFKEKFAETSSKILDASESFTVVSEKNLAHVLCPLCMPQMCGDEMEQFDTVSGGADPVRDTDICHVCGCSLGVSRGLVQANEQDRVVYQGSQEHDWDELLPKSTDLMSCELPLTKLLIKQWQGETDIHDLLKAQDTLVQQRKEEKIKEMKAELKEREGKTSAESLLQSLIEKVKGSQPEGNQIPRRSPSQSPSRSPSQSSTPSTPGYAATPQRLLARQRSVGVRDGRTSGSSTPTHPPDLGPPDSADLEDPPMFSFLSPKPLKSAKESSAVKRRKKHVSGF